MTVQLLFTFERSFSISLLFAKYVEIIHSILVEQLKKRLVLEVFLDNFPPGINTVLILMLRLIGD